MVTDVAVSDDVVITASPIPVPLCNNYCPFQEASKHESISLTFHSHHHWHSLFIGKVLRGVHHLNSMYTKF